MTSLKYLLILIVFTSSALAAPLRVGLVLDKNGKADKGFNAAAFSGLQQAIRALKISGDAVEAQADNGHEALLRDFAKKGYDLIIALGEARAPAVRKVAAEFPNSKFAIIDADVSAPNVRSILFKEQEGSYLVGALAALMSKTHTIGFLGGMKVPVIRRYEVGFQLGGKKIDSKIRILSDYIGTTSEAWNNKTKAHELALSEYASGADIIYAASGGSNLGVFDAADEKGKFAIGVSNQNWIKPGRILTSMRKRVDIAVLITCQDVMTGGFSAELKKYGLAEQGVDFVMDSFNEKLVPAAVLEKVNKLRDDITEEKIKVPSE